MFSKFHLFSSSFLLFALGCQPTPGTVAVVPMQPDRDNQGTKVQSLAPDTCLTTKVGSGKLYDGSKSLPSYLAAETLMEGDQAIYVVGQFPEHFDVNGLVAPNVKRTLLAKSTVWEWEVGPEQDESGQVTKFHVDKEVLNPDDNQAYVVTEKIYSFGDQVMINDDEDSLVIQCNIPAN